MTNKGWLSLRCLAPSAALGAAGLGTVWTLLRRSLPQTSGRLRLRGLHGHAEVLRDRWGVPHIYAQDVHDLYFAQGFCHAQDRLWQMEFNRRLASGRLSGWLGAAGRGEAAPWGTVTARLLGGGGVGPPLDAPLAPGGPAGRPGAGRPGGTAGVPR